MLPGLDALPAGASLLPVALAGGVLLVPLAVGIVVGYRTVGPTSDRLRAGARAGLGLTLLASAAATAYGAWVLSGASYDPSTLLTLLPLVALAWLLVSGLYMVCVTVIGSAVGGHLRSRRTYDTPADAKA